MYNIMQGLTEGSSKDNLVNVRSGLAEELTHLCPRCRFTPGNIKDDEFSCRGGLTKQIVYRARIVGTDVYSAPDLVSLMQSWVGSGRASVMVQSSRLHLDPTCTTLLDSLKSPDCEGEGNPTPKPQSTDSSAASKPKPDSNPQIGSSGASLGEIGGIAVGGVIIALLAILIVLIVVVVMWKMKSKVSLRLNLYNNSYYTLAVWRQL